MTLTEALQIENEKLKAEIRKLKGIDNSERKAWTEEFEKLWETYPRKRGLETAREKYLHQRKKDKKLPEKMALAIKCYKNEIAGNKVTEQYILNGGTFFNTRWRDYYLECFIDRRVNDSLLQDIKSRAAHDKHIR